MRRVLSTLGGPRRSATLYHEGNCDVRFNCSQNTHQTLFLTNSPYPIIRTDMQGRQPLLRILGIYQKEQMCLIVWAGSRHSSMSEVIHGYESPVTSVCRVW